VIFFSPGPHLTYTSSWCRQLWKPQLLCAQWAMNNSSPWHSTTANQIMPSGSVGYLRRGFVDPWRLHVHKQVRPTSDYFHAISFTLIRTPSYQWIFHSRSFISYRISGYFIYGDSFFIIVVINVYKRFLFFYKNAFFNVFYFSNVFYF